MKEQQQQTITKSHTVRKFGRGRQVDLGNFKKLVDKFNEDTTIAKAVLHEKPLFISIEQDIEGVKYSFDVVLESSLKVEATSIKDKITGVVCTMPDTHAIATKHKQMRVNQSVKTIAVAYATELEMAEILDVAKHQMTSTLHFTDAKEIQAAIEYNQGNEFGKNPSVFTFDKKNMHVTIENRENPELDSDFKVTRGYAIRNLAGNSYAKQIDKSQRVGANVILHDIRCTNIFGMVYALVNAVHKEFASSNIDEKTATTFSLASHFGISYIDMLGPLFYDASTVDGYNSEADATIGAAAQLLTGVSFLEWYETSYITRYDQADEMDVRNDSTTAKSVFAYNTAVPISYVGTEGKPTTLLDSAEGIKSWSASNPNATNYKRDNKFYNSALATAYDITKFVQSSSSVSGAVHVGAHFKGVLGIDNFKSLGYRAEFTTSFIQYLEVCGISLVDNDDVRGVFGTGGTPRYPNMNKMRQVGKAFKSERATPTLRNAKPGNISGF